jgi:PmbA protein
LYDNYTGNKAEVESTGNASRTGFVPYASTPVLEASNFVICRGNRSPEDLVGGVEEGLVVYGVQGAHSSNVESFLLLLRRCGRLREELQSTL